MHNPFVDGKNEEISAPNQKKSDITFSLPESDRPIIAKFLKDPETGKAAVLLDYFSHMIGNDPKKHSRRHPCRKSLGLGDSPEKDKFYELMARMGELKKQGKKQTPEYEMLREQFKKFRPQERGFVFYVEPDSPTIKCLAVGPLFLQRLFGQEKDDYRDYVPAITKELQVKGMSPYVDRDKEANKTGWVKIYKTGQGVNTKNHIELYTKSTEVDHEGEKVTVQKPIKCKLNESIEEMIETMASGNYGTDFENAVLERFPKPLEMEKEKNAWTFKESEYFVQQEGQLSGVPERLLSKREEDVFGHPAEDNTVKSSTVTTDTDTEENADTLDDVAF